MTKTALAAKRLNAFAMDPEDLLIIGLDTKDGPTHPLYDERVNLPLSEALTANIKTYGVIEPVVVRKVDDVPQVVDGRQRVRAAREANRLLKKAGLEPLLVPVILRRGSDDGMLGVMISANENRSDDLLGTKLKKLERFFAHGKDEEQAAIAFGVTPQTIKNWLVLMEASPQLRKLVELGQLSATAAVKIAGMAIDDQSDAIEEIKKGGKPTVERAKQIAKKKKTKGDVTTPPSRKILKRLLKRKDFDGDTGRVLRWVIGEGSSRNIPGLSTAVLREVGYLKDGEE